MKFISIVTAVLITCSSYGQGHIEYRDFKFYQNGAEISFEEVTELTKEYGVAKADFRQGRRDFAASQDRSRARGRNLINGTLVCSAFVGASSSILIGAIQADGGLNGSGEYHPASYITFFTLGAISTGGMIYYGSLLATKKKFKKRADKKFNKTAQKLNEAVKIGNSQ